MIGQPFVSLSRPVCGLDPSDPKTLETSFTQAYPRHEGIFCVQRPDDPAIALLDADLTGRITPVAGGRAQVRLSLCGNAPALGRWLGADCITGERLTPMALLIPVLGGMARLSVASVRWNRVASPSWAQKQGLLGGIRSDIGMLDDIWRTVPLRATWRQITGLRYAARSGADTEASGPPCPAQAPPRLNAARIRSVSPSALPCQSRRSPLPRRAILATIGP